MAKSIIKNEARWQVSGKKLLDVIEPDVPRKQAVERAVWTAARLRFVWCDDFTWERSKNTTRRSPPRASSKRSCAQSSP